MWSQHVFSVTLCWWFCFWFWYVHSRSLASGRSYGELLASDVHIWLEANYVMARNQFFFFSTPHSGWAIKFSASVEAYGITCGGHRQESSQDQGSLGHHWDIIRKPASIALLTSGHASSRRWHSPARSGQSFSWCEMLPSLEYKRKRKHMYHLGNPLIQISRLCNIILKKRAQ